MLFKRRKSEKLNMANILEGYPSCSLQELTAIDELAMHLEWSGNNATNVVVNKNDFSKLLRRFEDVIVKTQRDYRIRISQSPEKQKIFQIIKKHGVIKLSMTDASSLYALGSMKDYLQDPNESGYAQVTKVKTLKDVMVYDRVEGELKDFYSDNGFSFSENIHAFELEDAVIKLSDIESLKPILLPAKSNNCGNKDE